MVEFIPDLLHVRQIIASWHLPVQKQIKMQTMNFQYFIFESRFMLHCGRERLNSVSCDHACNSLVVACIGFSFKHSIYVRFVYFGKQEYRLHDQQI